MDGLEEGEVCEWNHGVKGVEWERYISLSSGWCFRLRGVISEAENGGSKILKME